MIFNIDFKVLLWYIIIDMITLIMESKYLSGKIYLYYISNYFIIYFL